MFIIIMKNSEEMVLLYERYDGIRVQNGQPHEAEGEAERGSSKDVYAVLQDREGSAAGSLPSRAVRVRVLGTASEQPGTNA